MSMLRSVYLIFCFIWLLLVNKIYAENRSNVSPSMERVVRTKYIGNRHVCNFGKITYCNKHYLPNLCMCYTPSNLLNEAINNSTAPLCSDKLKIDALQHVIITIGIGFPVPVEFLTDSDSLFVEDLEFFTNINRNSVIIMRKGCRPDRKVFEVQFGIVVNTTLQQKILTRYDLEIVNTSFFTTNLNFMEQNGLVIEYVTQTEIFRPLIGYPEWINGKQKNKNTIGKCLNHTSSPQYDCYFYELGAVFFGSIYLGSNIGFWVSVALINIVRRFRHAFYIAQNTDEKLVVLNAFFKQENRLIVV